MNSPIDTMNRLREDEEREIAKRAGIALIVFLVVFVTLLLWIANTKGFESPIVKPGSTYFKWENTKQN